MIKCYRCNICEYVNDDGETNICSNCGKKSKLTFVGYRYVAKSEVIVKRERIIFALNDEEAMEKFQNKDTEYTYNSRKEEEILKNISQIDN